MDVRLIRISAAAAAAGAAAVVMTSDGQLTKNL